ncbi:MAG: hypothetical protein ACF8LK_05920 [Phycisphaerales bacterium JB041]
MRTRTTSIAMLAGLAAGFLVSGAHAQVTRKPDAAPIRVDDRYAFDAARWERLYERGGTPTVMVLAGVATAERAGRGVGASLMSMDAEGDAFILKSELERTLLEGRGVEIANLDAISDMDRRDANLLLLNRERDAVDLLSSALDAPLALVARLQPGGRGGAKYRVTFEAIDVPRGRTLSTVAFDWQGGDDAREIKRYARLLANDFVDGYERHLGGHGISMPYTVRVLGADTRGLRDMVDTLERAPGVERVSVGQRQQSRDTSIAELRVRYVGSAFDLTGDLLDAGDANGLELDSLDMTSGTIVVRAVAGEGQMRGASTWRMRGPTLSMDDIDTRALTDAYRDAGEPRIAMLIGRALSPWELKQPWFFDRYGTGLGLGERGVGGNDITATLGGSNVFINIGEHIQQGNSSLSGRRSDRWGGVVTPDYEPRAPEHRLLETRRLEDLMLDRLGPGDLGLRMVDAVTLRERALAENPRFVFREAEMIELIRQSGLADIAILGDGRLERERGYSTVRYTLRAIELETGEVLAVAPAAVEIDDRADMEEVNQVLGVLADQASARLVSDLTAAWHR